MGSFFSFYRHGLLFLAIMLFTSVSAASVDSRLGLPGEALSFEAAISESLNLEEDCVDAGLIARARASLPYLSKPVANPPHRASRHRIDLHCNSEIRAPPVRF